MWRDYRSEFNWIKHAALPVISIAAMIWVLWGNIHPYPPAPLRWFIYATVGVLLIGVLIARWLAKTRPEAMERAGLLLADVELEHEDAIAGLEADD
jgi:membrane protease YdiL (CAAX protease family)